MVDLRLLAGLGNDVFEQDCPADEGVASFADAGLDGQVQVAGFVDKAGDFAGSLGDVQEQTTAARRSRVDVGHEGSLLVSHGAGPRHRVRPR